MHVARVVETLSGNRGWSTVEFNTGTHRACTRQVRRIDEPKLRGAMVYPRAEIPEVIPSNEDVAAIGRLLEMERRVWAGESGQDAIEAALSRRG